MSQYRSKMVEGGAVHIDDDDDDDDDNDDDDDDDENNQGDAKLFTSRYQEG